MEIRTGGHWSIVWSSRFSSSGTIALKSDATWWQRRLHQVGIPYLKYKPERATMVFPVTGELGRIGIVSVECVKRTTWVSHGSEADFMVFGYKLGESWWVTVWLQSACRAP
eukprot:SAG31_NODE_14068_length_829_cov_0.884932_1_plen_111_part_00